MIDNYLTCSTMLFLLSTCRCSDVTLHKADAIPKNEFLQDLEKQEVCYK